MGALSDTCSFCLMRFFSFRSACLLCWERCGIPVASRGSRSSPAHSPHLALREGFILSSSPVGPGSGSESPGRAGYAQHFPTLCVLATVEVETDLSSLVTIQDSDMTQSKVCERKF